MPAETRIQTQAEVEEKMVENADAMGRYFLSELVITSSTASQCLT